MLSILNAIGSVRLLDAYTALRPADRLKLATAAAIALATGLLLIGPIATLIERAG